MRQKTQNENLRGRGELSRGAAWCRWGSLAFVVGLGWAGVGQGGPPEAFAQSPGVTAQEVEEEVDFGEEEAVAFDEEAPEAVLHRPPVSTRDPTGWALLLPLMLFGLAAGAVRWSGAVGRRQ